MFNFASAELQISSFCCDGGRNVAGDASYRGTIMNGDWNRESWKRFTARQQPEWLDISEVRAVQEELAGLPPLVDFAEILSLKRELALAARGKSFVIQGGDCSENFCDNTSWKVGATCKTLMNMGAAVWLGTGVPVIRIGRMAGQFAKPRSSGTETAGGTVYPSYRGDMVNDYALGIHARRPDPRRMLKGYREAGKTLGYIQKLREEGFFALARLSEWNRQLQDNRALYGCYSGLIDEYYQRLEAARSVNPRPGLSPDMSPGGLYVSHEALLLPYEEAMIRRGNGADGRWYSGSAHMLWIGERTRQLDSAQVEMMRGVANPIGVKVGPGCRNEDISTLCTMLNPSNEPGKLTLITRFGKDNIERYLPPLIEEIQRTGRKVTWLSDPMHGNTFTSNSGYKTRKYEDIMAELESFFRIHLQLGSHAGGIHLEMSGENVTECLGGCCGIRDEQLSTNYRSSCDPRLNETQSLELAFAVSRILNTRAYVSEDTLAAAEKIVSGS
ncbi:MAG: 3-deoxy-7-phosphoheptulonate synthase class II [Desulfobacterales bacterium]|nr:MAG: 3-deoxy-7-phosphoheptulonate synthase class II [Desulfobacterales bacterium]